METIAVRFVVASDEVIAALAHLGREIALESHAGHVQPAVLEQFIAGRFSVKALTDSINNFSNQWLVAYAGEFPIGFACLSAKGQKPAALENKRSLGITTFYIRQQYQQQPALLEKCLDLGKHHEAMWLTAPADSPLLPFFERAGFRKGEGVDNNAAPLPFVYLLRP